MKRAVDRYVESLLQRRRPKAFVPSEEDLVAARTAIGLLADTPDAYTPSAGFVDGLRRRITALEDEETQAAPARPAAQPEPAVQARPARNPRRVTGLITGRATGTGRDNGFLGGLAVTRGTGLVAGRRGFLQVGALTATGAAAGLAADRLLSDRTDPATQGAGGAPNLGVLSPATGGSWQTVAASADLHEGDVLSFDQGPVTGFVRRVSGRVQAVSATCTHQACRLALNTPQTTLVCPCHGATFALDGTNLTHPLQVDRPLPALPRVPVRETEGVIQIYAPSPSPSP